MNETHRIHTQMQGVQAAEAWHIRLGEKGGWAQRAIDEGLLIFGDPNIPHELPQAGDWDAVRPFYKNAGNNKTAVTNQTNGMRDFYTLKVDCLWVTFARGKLWWAFAEPKVHFDGSRPDCRWRKTIGPWRCTDVTGKTLYRSELSSILTNKISNATISRIKALPYLLRKINCGSNPAVQPVVDAEMALAAQALVLIRELHEKDFEILAARVAGSLGWRIGSAVGGSQPDIDFEADLPALDLKAIFQVKCKASQKQVDQFAAIDAEGKKHLVFITHDARKLSANGRANLSIWAGEELAFKAIRAGLLPWIIERTR